MRVVLARVVRTVFTVTGARDSETERRSWLLLVVAAAVLLQLGVSMLTVPLAGTITHAWVLAVPLGVPIMLVVFLLARRASAGLAALLFSVYAFVLLVVLAWAGGPGGNQMSAVITGIVGVGAVLRPRLTAAFGVALLGVVTTLALAQSVGSYVPLDGSFHEPIYMPFMRQSLALGLLVYALRRGYDRLRAQVVARERSRAATVDAARTINTSLEAMVSERTATLAATRDRTSEIAARVANELTASLETLRRQLGGLATAPLGADATRYVARATAAAERLATMIERLHEHARLGTTALRRTMVDMDAVVRDVVDDFRRTGGDARVVWQVDVLPRAWTDLALIRAVVENLISNAVKFSRPRTPPRIHIGFDAARGYFVRDNGVGFDADRAHALFSPFHRLHADAAFEGYGLGLANVRRILEHLDGEITAEGALDLGATFWFRLPRDIEAR